MIASTWPAYFRHRYGDKWPDTYFCFDTETSGFNQEKDVILEIGHCLVENGKVVDRGSYPIDWRGHSIVQEEWLRQKISYISDEMRKQGKVFHCTWDYLCANGTKPNKVFAFYMRFFADLMANGCAFAGHNLAFDEGMFAHNAVGFGYAIDFALPEDKFWDTHAIEKVNQMAGDVRALPRQAETLRDYFTRVGRGFSRIKSNLDRHCFTKYKFAEKGLKLGDCHGASADAFMVHLLMEEFRVQASLHGTPGATQEVPEAASSSTAAGGFAPQEIPWGDYERKHPAQPAAGPHPVRYRGQRNN